MKKVLNILLITLTICIDFNIAFAEKDIRDMTVCNVSVACAQGSCGDKVNIPIILSNNIGFGDLELEIKYDASALKLESVNANKNVGGIFTPAQNISANPFNISWNSTNNNDYNGVLASLCFEILTETPGIYPLNISYFKGKDGSNVDGEDVNYAYSGKDMQEFVPLKMRYTNGYIQVGNMLSGDLTLNILINDKKYSKQLVSEYKSTGFIYIIVYDKKDCIIGIKACPVEEILDIDLGRNANADYLKIIFWENMISMKPLYEIQTIDLAS